MSLRADVQTTNQSDVNNNKLLKIILNNNIIIIKREENSVANLCFQGGVHVFP